MNVVYEEFKKELYSKPDRSITYFCDESGNTQ